MLALRSAGCHSTLSFVKKTTIVAPYDDPLALAVAGEARVLGRSVAVLLPVSTPTRERKKVGRERPAEAAPEPGSAVPEERPIAWNPPSFVSARTAVLEASVRFGSVDEAVLVLSLGPAPGLTAKPSEIEKILQDRVLSFIWLVRELLTHFSARGTAGGSGRLILVLADRGQSPRDPVAAAAFGALSAFAASLAETPPDAPYDVWVVQDSCPQDDLAAQYLSRILQAPPERRPGRVLRFTGKNPLFNRP